MIRTRQRARAFIFMFMFMLASAGFDVAQGETIGPYEIVATPSSAVLLFGGGAGFNWLNVVNTPVTIDEALTGFSVIDDGYGNAQGGTALRLTYAPGVLRNQAGPDLVMFDAGTDQTAYLVSTSHDNFSRIVVVAAFSDTGVDRSYFFGGQGPTPFDVSAATIDLSSLSIPIGQTVNQVRIFAEVSSCDPLGLGVLAPPPQEIPALSLWGLIAGGFLLLVAGARSLSALASPRV